MSLQHFTKSKQGSTIINDRHAQNNLYYQQKLNRRALYNGSLQKFISNDEKYQSQIQAHKIFDLILNKVMNINFKRNDIPKHVVGCSVQFLNEIIEQEYFSPDLNIKQVDEYAEDEETIQVVKDNWARQQTQRKIKQPNITQNLMYGSKKEKKKQLRYKKRMQKNYQQKIKEKNSEQYKMKVIKLIKVQQDFLDNKIQTKETEYIDTSKSYKKPKINLLHSNFRQIIQKQQEQQESIQQAQAKLLENQEKQKYKTKAMRIQLKAKKHTYTYDGEVIFMKSKGKPNEISKNIYANYQIKAPVIKNLKQHRSFTKNLKTMKLKPNFHPSKFKLKAIRHGNFTTQNERQRLQIFENLQPAKGVAYVEAGTGQLKINRNQLRYKKMNNLRNTRSMRMSIVEYQTLTNQRNSFYNQTSDSMVYQRLIQQSKQKDVPAIELKNNESLLRKKATKFPKLNIQNIERYDSLNNFYPKQGEFEKETIRLKQILKEQTQKYLRRQIQKTELQTFNDQYENLMVGTNTSRFTQKSQQSQASWGKNKNQEFQIKRPIRKSTQKKRYQSVKRQRDYKQTQASTSRKERNLKMNQSDYDDLLLRQSLFNYQRSPVIKI